MNKNIRAVLLTVGVTLILSSCAQGNAVPKDAYRTYYEIFVRSFYDSDSDGSGDLNGVIKKLDYISDLGADGIWLMPVMPSPSYHKYDVSDYLAIDSQYGSMEDFEKLSAECDKRGISLIIDLILNHTSSEHPWFRSAVQSIATEPCGESVCKYETLCRAHNKYCGYYNFAETNQGQGYYVLPNGWYYEGVFWDQMPDLNLDDENVRNEITDILSFWLGKGIAGFRLDAPLHYYNQNTSKNVAFLNWLNTEAKKIKSDAYIVGEVWSDAGTIANYYESGVDSFFNFPFAQAEGVISSSIAKKNGYGFASAVSSWQNKIDSSIDAPFLSNHDNARSAGFLMQNLEKEKLAASMYLLLPGNPFIYYGEEIGMTGSGKDENKRQPMVWSVTDMTGIALPVEGTDQTQKLTAGVAEQLKDRGSLLMFYRSVLEIRNRYPEIARGTVSAIDVGNSNICALLFEYDGSSVYVLHNLSDKESPVAINDLFKDVKIRSSLFPSGGKTSVSLMPGYSTYIIE